MRRDGVPDKFSPCSSALSARQETWVEEGQRNDGLIQFSFLPHSFYPGSARFSESSCQKIGFLVENSCSCLLRDRSVAAEIDRGHRGGGRERQWLPLCFVLSLMGNRHSQHLLSALRFTSIRHCRHSCGILCCLYAMSIQTLSKKAPAFLQYVSVYEDLLGLKLVSSLGLDCMPAFISAFTNLFSQ